MSKYPKYAVEMHLQNIMGILEHNRDKSSLGPLDYINALKIKNTLNEFSFRDAERCTAEFEGYIDRSHSNSELRSAAIEEMRRRLYRLFRFYASIGYGHAAMISFGDDPVQIAYLEVMDNILGNLAPSDLETVKKLADEKMKDYNLSLRNL